MPVDDSSEVAGVVACIARETGQTLTLARRFEVGSGAGAYAIRDGEGTPLVLKWWPNEPAEQQRFAIRGERIPVLRKLGWPIPPLRHRGIAGSCLFEIWDVAPGEPCVTAPAPAAVITRSSELVALARGAAQSDGLDWPTWLSTWITSRLDRIQPVASAEAIALIDSCRKALAATDIPPGRDLIHGDFTPANLLVDENRLTAVVDLDDCRDGDGTLDLIGIVWDLEGWEKVSSDVVDRLWTSILQQVDADYGRVLLAYWIAGTLDWATGTEDEVRKTSLAHRAWSRFTSTGSHNRTPVT